MSHTEALTEIPGLFLCCPFVPWEQGWIPPAHTPGKVSEEGLPAHGAPFPCLAQGIDPFWKGSGLQELPPEQVPPPALPGAI